jgi:S1-C subfamily serine protease
MLESRITELRCHVKDQDTSASLVLEDCPVIEGNSGSPAVNTSGEVVGVIWGANASDLTTQTDLTIRRSGYGIGIVTESFHFTEFTKI